MNIKHINWVISEHVLSYDQAEEFTQPLCDLNLFFGSFCCLFVCCFLWRSISNQVACCSAKQYLVAFSFLSCSYLGWQISQFSFYKEVCGLISPSWEKLLTTVALFFCFLPVVLKAPSVMRNVVIETSFSQWRNPFLKLIMKIDAILILIRYLCRWVEGGVMVLLITLSLIFPVWLTSISRIYKAK